MGRIKKRKVAVSSDSSQKRKVAVLDDSAQKARRDMIRQMQKGTEPKTSRKSKIKKSYNGVKWE